MASPSNFPTTQQATNVVQGLTAAEVIAEITQFLADNGYQTGSERDQAVQNTLANLGLNPNTGRVGTAFTSAVFNPTARTLTFTRLNGTTAVVTVPKSAEVSDVVFDTANNSLTVVSTDGSRVSTTISGLAGTQGPQGKFRVTIYTYTAHGAEVPATPTGSYDGTSFTNLATNWQVEFPATQINDPSTFDVYASFATYDPSTTGVQALTWNAPFKADAEAGIPGLAGNDGWTPSFALVSDGERRVLQVSDWTGGEGTKPTIGQYVGSTGLVNEIANGIDIRGPKGEDGTGDNTGDGGKGDNGWSPVLAVISDGTRRVLQVSDWTGGEGTKPATGSYIGATGFVTAIASAIDIRGPAGAGGGSGGGSGPESLNELLLTPRTFADSLRYTNDDYLAPVAGTITNEGTLMVGGENVQVIETPDPNVSPGVVQIYLKHGAALTGNNPAITFGIYLSETLPEGYTLSVKSRNGADSTYIELPKTDIGRNIVGNRNGMVGTTAYALARELTTTELANLGVSDTTSITSLSWTLRVTGVAQANPDYTLLDETAIDVVTGQHVAREYGVPGTANTSSSITITAASISGWYGFQSGDLTTSAGYGDADPESFIIDDEVFKILELSTNGGTSDRGIFLAVDKPLPAGATLTFTVDGTAITGVFDVDNDVSSTTGTGIVLSGGFRPSGEAATATTRAYYGQASGGAWLDNMEANDLTLTAVDSDGNDLDVGLPTETELQISIATEDHTGVSSDTDIRGDGWYAVVDRGTAGGGTPTDDTALTARLNAISDQTGETENIGKANVDGQTLRSILARLVNTMSYAISASARLFLSALSAGTGTTYVSSDTRFIVNRGYISGKDGDGNIDRDNIIPDSEIDVTQQNYLTITNSGFWTDNHLVALNMTNIHEADILTFYATGSGTAIRGVSLSAVNATVDGASAIKFATRMVDASGNYSNTGFVTRAGTDISVDIRSDVRMALYLEHHPNTPTQITVVPVINGITCDDFTITRPANSNQLRIRDELESDPITTVNKTGYNRIKVWDLDPSIYISHSEMRTNYTLLTTDDAALDPYVHNRTDDVITIADGTALKGTFQDKDGNELGGGATSSFSSTVEILAKSGNSTYTLKAGKRVSDIFLLGITYGSSANLSGSSDLGTANGNTNKVFTSTGLLPLNGTNIIFGGAGRGANNMAARIVSTTGTLTALDIRGVDLTDTISTNVIQVQVVYK